MIRNSHLVNITVQMPNPLMQMSFGMPVYMTHLQTITDADGKQVGNPLPQQTPIIPSDVTPELLDAINTQLATIGLKLGKIDA